MAFVPKTDLEKAVHGGDPDATLALLRACTPAQRAVERASVARMLELANTARWSSPPLEWGGPPSAAQLHAVDIAIVLCGTARDVAHSRVRDEMLLSLCHEFKPRSLDGLADAMLARSPAMIRPVSKLIAAGLAPRPETDAYTLGLISLPRTLRSDAELSALFDADPGLRPALLRVFDVEGTGDVSLASSDKYNHNPRTDWVTLLKSLVDDGVATRAQLLDRTLGALEKDWPQYRAGWFSRFHGALEPTTEELRAHLPRYLALCASRIAPTVTLALEVLGRVDAEAPIGADDLLEALRPVMASSVKTQLEAALKLLDRLVAREPGGAARASDVAAMGLLHANARLQATVLARLSTWGVDEALRVRLDGLAAHVGATNRAALQALLGAPADVPPPPPAAPATPGRGPADPLADDRRLAPIADLPDLADTIAHVFEHAEDVDDFERAIAGLVAATPIVDAKALFGPVLKRAARVKGLLPRELARLLRFVAASELAPGQVGVDNGGNASPADALLVARIDELARSTIAGHRLTPLATPTHREGFIAPVALVERWQAHAAAGVAPTEAEQERALLRLAPGAAPPVLAAARALADSPFVRALRYALADDIAPGAERRLFAAAARIRHPGADDAALDARHPGLGPDGALAARYAMRLESRTHEYDGKSYTHHDVMLEARPPCAADEDAPLAARRHCGQGKARLWFRWSPFAGIDAGAIRHSATLLPSDLRAFFAEGVRAFGNNLDWWEAQWQNRAYLEPLLDPATPMTDMANLLLLLALCGKEPGQTAIAVDALVQAHAEGRIDATALAAALRELVAGPLPKLARLHKSLQAALRADPGLGELVFTLLGAAVLACPENPPRDMALLLGLLLELRVDGPRDLPPALRAAVAAMKLGGNGKAIQKQLLQA
ncbi:MAG: hypothetical protein JF586_11575 [Burkholderiales bacterium]|nr:hypothetical protein [Burkholderiales bacterium]